MQMKISMIVENRQKKPRAFHFAWNRKIKDK